MAGGAGQLHVVARQGMQQYLHNLTGNGNGNGNQRGLDEGMLELRSPGSIIVLLLVFIMAPASLIL